MTDEHTVLTGGRASRPSCAHSLSLFQMSEIDGCLPFPLFAIRQCSRRASSSQSEGLSARSFLPSFQLTVRLNSCVYGQSVSSSAQGDHCFASSPLLLLPPAGIVVCTDMATLTDFSLTVGPTQNTPSKYRHAGKDEGWVA